VQGLHPEYESVLVSRVIHGDQEAFTTLFRTYQPMLLTVAVKMVKLDTLAEEICNDVFLQVWQRRSELAAIQSIQAYLLTAVKNRSINCLKSMARNKAMVLQIGALFPAAALHTEEAVLSKEYLHFIHQQIGLLPPRSRMVFQLCREQGYSYDKAAGLLGISRNAVKNHMVYSMKKLTAYIRKDLGISFPGSYILLALLIHFF